MARASAAPCLSDRATGMALSVLAEIGRMLEALSESGQAGAIDLRSLPLGIAAPATRSRAKKSRFARYLKF